MAYFIALGILSLAGIVGTVWLVRTDGYGRIPTDQRRSPAREPRPVRASRAQRRAAQETHGVEAREPRRAAKRPAAVHTP